MEHGKVISYQESWGNFPGHLVFKLNLEEWKVLRCTRTKMSQGLETGILIGQEADTWRLSRAYCVPGDVQSSLIKLVHSTEKTEAQRG